jgi:hypothetical protein
MIKTYRKQGAMLRSMCLPVDLDKGSVRVLFSGGAISPVSGNCSFSTDDKALQKALEKHRLFNDPDGFVLEGGVNAGKSAANEGASVPDVRDFNAAKEYILKNFKGYSLMDVSSSEKTRALAENIGIAFPNWM